ncbi:MAG: DegT/DnrJ/EryC1/StrS family aminotransferase [Chloroflexi bacterium]|nr:DegT/DnrJ/EryC1/StrS family aminotransferase [Chloroflexota bacterium]
MREEIDAALARVISRGRFILGPEVEAFEGEFAAFCGKPYAIGLGSGTEALHLALWAAGVGQGDEVITVPNTAVATVAAIELAGARPVFVDIDPRSYNLDPSLLQAAITPRTKAIIPVHLYGQAADMEPTLGVAAKQGIKVIEDCAQAHGATYKGKPLPFGEVGMFSFYPTKNLGGYGDGGMVVTDKKDFAERVSWLREYGWTERYFSQYRGTNSRLDEIQAAVLRVKLQRLRQWNERRRSLAGLYDRLLSKTPVTIPMRMEYGEPVYHLYVLRSPARGKLKNFLKEKGVDTLIHYPYPIHLMPAYADLAYGEGSFPQAEAHAREVLSLPLYAEMGEKEVEQVAELIVEFFQTLGKSETKIKGAARR